ncbi:ribonuclease III [Weeksellaceae bacterium TAE3-ERU29]|nr:ribonuclease III [Weeksellaceae bacterium TAE3-ERU29]
MSQNFWTNFLHLFQKKRKHQTIDAKLLNILGFSPKNTKLFIEALTPRSAQLKSNTGYAFNYERLEFLGDAMLGAVIADYLYINAPHEREGYLTKMRSKIVSRRNLNKIGTELGLIRLIDDDIKKNITLGANISGDMFESLVGAIYEDQGFNITKDFIYRTVITPYVDLNSLENRISSYKSLILEWAQKNKIALSFTTLEEDNAENIRIFASALSLNGKEVSKGRGTSKKKAEEKAAKRAYFNFQRKINQ